MAKEEIENKILCNMGNIQPHLKKCLAAGVTPMIHGSPGI